MKVCFTVDVEQDCPPFMETFRGIEEGMPRLLALLAQRGVAGTFFTTGEVARRYPDTIRAVVTAGHELGCHGDTHRRFDACDEAEARQEIRAATSTLRQLAPVVSFRAPNLRFPERYVPLLEQEQYRLDSSQARYKSSRGLGRTWPSSLLRVPASLTSSVLRLPRWIRERSFRRQIEPVVLFVHPWEFVDLRHTRLRIDCRFRTGQAALDCVGQSIDYFAQRGAQFVPMRDLLAASPDAPGLNASLPARSA